MMSSADVTVSKHVCLFVYLFFKLSVNGTQMSGIKKKQKLYTTFWSRLAVLNYVFICVLIRTEVLNMSPVF